MDTVSVVALAVGAVGLVGGIVGVWVAMRRATRVTLKIIAAMRDSASTLGQLERRVHLLEEWRRQNAAPSTPSPLPPPPPPSADT